MLGEGVGTSFWGEWVGTGTSTQDVVAGLQKFDSRTNIHTDLWGSDINAGCGVRDITVAVRAQIYTLIVGAVTSTLGGEAGALMWLWGHRYTH
jgi:hypothetical protein